MLKGQINEAPLTLHQFQTNGKLSVSLYLNFHHEMSKYVKIMYQTCKIKIVVKIFWGPIGNSPLVETC